MKKKYTVLICVLIIIFTLLRVTSSDAIYTGVSLSGGSISDTPLHDETEYESILQSPAKGMTGLGLHVKYPYGREISDEAIYIRVEDADTGEMILEGETPLKNCGYSGDTLNEGVLLIPFPEPVAGNRSFRLLLRGSGIDKEEKVTLRLRNSPRITGALTCNGESVEGGLYGTAYCPGEKRGKIGAVLPGVLLVAVILIWSLLGNKKPVERRKERKKEETKATFKSHLSLSSITKKQWGKLILFLILQVIVLEYGYYAGIRPSLDEQKEVNQKSNGVIRISQGEAVSFDLLAESRDLSGVGMVLKYDYHTDQTVNISVSEKKSGLKIVEVDYVMDRILPDRNGDIQLFHFPEAIHSSKNIAYEVTLQYLSGSGDIELAAAKTEDEEKEPDPYVRGLYRNRMFLRKLYILISLLTILGTCLIWLFSIRRIDWQRWFPAVFILAGLCFMLLIKPLSVPDEYIHFDEAYKISNSLLGIRQSEFPDGIYKRSCDVITDVLSKEKMNGEAYRWERDLLRGELKNWPIGFDEDLQLVYARSSGNSTSWIYYLPAAVGMTAGRLLGMGLLGIFYMARLFQFFAGVCLLTFAIRRISVGKPILVSLAFMPIMMMELVSVSYDAVIIPACFACIAAAAEMVMEPEKRSVNDVFLLLLLTALAGMNKAGVYLPIGLLSATGLYRWYRSGGGEKISEFLPQKSKKKSRIRMMVPVLLFAVIAGIIITRFFGIYRGKLSLSGTPGYNSRTEKGSYSLAYLLNHPMQTLRLIEGTLYLRTSTIFNITGADIGWVYLLALELGLRMISIIYIAFACIRINGEKVLEKSTRILCVIIFIISTLGFNYAMLTSWTGLGAVAIDGVQARYYLPVLPLLLLSLRSVSPVYMNISRANGALTNDFITGTVSGESEAYRNKCERNLAVAGYGLSVLAMVSFVIRALG